MSLLRIALCSILMLSAMPAIAATAPKINVSLRDVISTVETAFKPDRSTGLPPLQDVTADFMQSSTLVEKGREMRADGQMYFKTATANQPLKFRFDYFRPANQEVVTDGRTMWVYLPANRQVIQSDVSFAFNPFNFNPERTRAVNFLQGLGRISQDFQINFSSQMRDIEGNWILELNPRRHMETINRLFIVVSQESVLSRLDPAHFPYRQELAFPILSTTVIDHQGNSTIMEFSNIRTNTRMSDSIFFFTVPPDAQVVRPPAGR